MDKCKTCRFFNGNDYAEAINITESVPVRMQLND